VIAFIGYCVSSIKNISNNDAWNFQTLASFLWQLDARISKDSRPRASEVMYGLVYWHFYISLSLHVCDISLGTFWCAAHISNRCKKSTTHSSSGSHHSVTNYFLIYFVSRCRLRWVATQRIASTCER
jgi:hypothetical protein